MFRPIIIATILLLAMGIWMASSVFWPKNEEPTQAEQNVLSKKISPFKISVYESNAKSITRTLTAQGSIEPFKTINLSNHFAGTIKHILHKKGDCVKKGDLIYSFDEENYPYKLAAAKADMELKKAELKASKRLLAKNLEPPIEYIRKKVFYEQSRSAYQEALKKLDYTKIYAPSDGQLSEGNVEIGDFIKEHTSLGKIVILSHLKIITYIPQQMIRFISLGEITDIRIQSDVKKYQGKIIFIAPVANNKTRNFKIEIELDNPNYKIYAGQSATLTIPTETVDAHFLPSSLLNINNEGSLAIKYIDEATHRVAEAVVKIIQTDKDGVWVTGLPKQILLISQGQGFISPGEILLPEALINDAIENTIDEDNH